MKIKLRTKDFLVVCLTMVLLTACQTVGNNTLVATDTYTGVIFTAENTEQARVLWQEPEGYWTPSKTDINVLEGDIGAFLQENAELFYREPPIWQRLPEYKRQYFGIVEEGHQVVYANFFCIDPEMDWHNQFLFVMDGGDCFFQVKYSIEAIIFTISLSMVRPKGMPF